MTFTPYLHFAGTAREAMTFYAGVFGARDLVIRSAAEAPEGYSFAGGVDRVMHAQFSTGPGATLMAADLPEAVAPGGGGSAVLHEAPTLDTAREVFERLSEGAEIMLPFGPTFWSPGFGGLRDRYGTSWMITVRAG